MRREIMSPVSTLVANETSGRGVDYSTTLYRDKDISERVTAGAGYQSVENRCFTMRWTLDRTTSQRIQHI